MGWFIEGAHVNRVVNMAYLLTVAVFGISVFLLCWRLKNRNAVRLYLMSIPIWLFIEGGSLLAGIRVYEGANVYFVLFVVAFMEDPAWVALAYLASEKIARRWMDQQDGTAQTGRPLGASAPGPGARAVRSNSLPRPGARSVQPIKLK